MPPNFVQSCKYASGRGSGKEYERTDRQPKCRPVALSPGYAFTAFFLPSLTVSSLTRSNCSESGAKARKQIRAFSESSPSSRPVPRPRNCSREKRSNASPNTSQAVTGDGSSARLVVPGTSGGDDESSRAKKTESIERLSSRSKMRLFFYLPVLVLESGSNRPQSFAAAE